MNDRARRPAPRTLAATPPPSSRVPHATQYQARFPSLVAVLAGGALVPACHAPECGDSRADELQSHGAESMRAARRGEPASALREIGVALGVVSHTNTSRISAPGEVAPVTTLPRPVTEPVIVPSGAAPMVNPTPVMVPQPPDPLQPRVVPQPRVPPAPIPPSGGIRAVEPAPRQPPVPPHRTTRPHAPTEPRPAVPGGMGMVSPVPAQTPLETEGGVRAVTAESPDLAQR